MPRKPVKPPLLEGRPSTQQIEAMVDAWTQPDEVQLVTADSRAVLRVIASPLFMNVMVLSAQGFGDGAFTLSVCLTPEGARALAARLVVRADALEAEMLAEDRAQLPRKRTPKPKS